MEDNIKTCIDVALSWEDQIKAAEIARREREENDVQDAKLIPDAIRGGFDMDALGAVLMTSKKWQVGRQIKVAFMDGSKALRDRVFNLFITWEPHANLDLVLIDSVKDADVRVTFTRGGSWSYVGTDCLLIPNDRPTMQLGWVDENSAEEEIRRVAVHEWGHTMGLGHEHQHPQGGIPWDKEKTYDYYMRTQGWSKEDVDQQVFQVLNINQTNFSVYDPMSIMHYPIAKELLTDPSRAVGWNTQLSANDKAFASTAYPGAAEPTEPTEPEEPAGYKPGVRRRSVKAILRGYRDEFVGTLNDREVGYWEPKE